MPTLNPYPQPLTPYPNPLAAPQVRALRLWVAALRVARIYLRTIRPLHTRVVQRRRATLLYLPCISPVSQLYLRRVVQRRRAALLQPPHPTPKPPHPSHP